MKKLCNCCKQEMDNKDLDSLGVLATGDSLTDLYKCVCGATLSFNRRKLNKVSEVISKVRNLKLSDAISMQVFVSGKITDKRKNGASLEAVKKELRESLKELIRKSDKETGLNDNMFEKLIYALALVNSYPVLKTFKRRV